MIFALSQTAIGLVFKEDIVFMYRVLFEFDKAQLGFSVLELVLTQSYFKILKSIIEVLSENWGKNVNSHDSIYFKQTSTLYYKNR